MVSGVQCLVFGVWCLAVGSRCLVSGGRCSMFGVCFLLLMKGPFLVSGGRCLVFGVWRSVFGVWRSVFGVWCLVFTPYERPFFGVCTHAKFGLFVLWEGLRFQTVWAIAKTAASAGQLLVGGTADKVRALTWDGRPTAAKLLAIFYLLSKKLVVFSFSFRISTS
jgi:hypothetical protein